MQINSLYICVKDMERAIEFYQQLFDRVITIHDTVYSVFVLGEFRFGLFAYERMQERHTFGSNCLPRISISVEDFPRVKVLLEKFALKIIFPLTQIGENMVFEFEDTEGNHIEVNHPIIESR